MPLYGRILGAVALGLVVGVMLGGHASSLEAPAKLVLRVLGALAPPLILLAIVQALMRAHLGGRQALRLVALLLTNTLVAIGIGLLVANVIRPGSWSKAAPGPEPAKARERRRSARAAFRQRAQEHRRAVFGQRHGDGRHLHRGGVRRRPAKPQKSRGAHGRRPGSRGADQSDYDSALDHRFGAAGRVRHRRQHRRREGLSRLRRVGRLRNRRAPGADAAGRPITWHACGSAPGFVRSIFCGERATRW